MIAMEVNALELREQAEEAAKSRLNSLVAVTIALLATFMGICKVKDDNIVQAMQQAQANSVDRWGEYQAKNTQSKLYEVAAAQFQLQADSANGKAQALAAKQAKLFGEQSKREAGKKDEASKKAQQAEKDYNDENFKDDQFDLSDASLAIAIALLAVTSLTQKRWLFFIALVPTVIGVLMGLAGLLGWGIHPDFVIKLLS